MRGLIGLSLVREIVVVLFRPLRKLYRMVLVRIVRKYLYLHGVEIGENLRATSFPTCRCHPQGKIRIGDNCTILNKLTENLAGIVHPTVLYAGRNGLLQIGNNVGISGAVLYCTTEIVIEDNVNIGANSKIYDTDFHPISAMERRKPHSEQIGKASVRVCEDVWVGADVTILKGVKIGARSIVGAGSLVTKDVPPDSIVAGRPARVIKHIEK
jgi:acetyltransferase-like isoleucine patch superfamily enzyme